MGGIVFISYAHADGGNFAIELEKWLESNEVGLLAFLDTTELKPGDEWKRKIDLQIENCFLLIVLITRGAMQSHFVTYEWSYALGLGRKVLPLKITLDINEEEIHPKLRDIQYYPFTKPTETDWRRFKEVLLEYQRAEEVPPAVVNAGVWLDSPLPEHRVKAIDALKKISHPSATRKLREAVGHDTPDVRMDAGIALAEKTNYQDKAAIPGLEEALRDSSKARNALDALRRMNNGAAADCLFRSYDKVQSYLQRDIVDALSQFTDPEVVPYLRELWRQKGSRYTVILEKLAQLGDEGSIPEIIEFLKAENTTTAGKLLAVKLLAHYDHPDVIQPLFQAVSDHRNAHYHEEQQIFHSALDALANTNSEEALNMLEGVFQHPQFRNARSVIHDKINLMKKKMSER